MEQILLEFISKCMDSKKVIRSQSTQFYQGQILLDQSWRNDSPVGEEIVLVVVFL